MLDRFSLSGGMNTTWLKRTQGRGGSGEQLRHMSKQTKISGCRMLSYSLAAQKLVGVDGTACVIFVFCEMRNKYSVSDDMGTDDA